MVRAEVIAFRAVAAFGRLLHRIADAPVPPEVRAQDLLYATFRTEVLAAFVRLGLPDELDGRSLTAAQLAARVDADPAGMLRLLRVAERVGLVRRRGGGYRLTATGRVLRRAHPTSIAPFVRHSTSDSIRAAWARFPDAVRANASQFEAANGMTLWDWFATHPDEERDFAATMRTLTDLSDCSDAYPWRPGQVVCDIGGGVGTTLSQVLAPRPTLRGVLVDRAEVLGEARELLGARGVADRVRCMAGDLFARPPAVADVFLLKDVLHDWDDERAGAILRVVRSVMRPTDRLVLIETVQDPDSAHPLAPFLDLIMLVQTDGGRQRTIAEFDRLLAAADLRRTAVHAAPLHSLIEATPAPGLHSR